MCGIVGFWSNKKINSHDIVKTMADTLTHRGPDDSGTWVDENNGVAFGHRRLSIIDLSPAGHQPMVSSSERYVITFNGEIYNFKSIRKEIEESQKNNYPCISFKGNSDTEVILSAVEAFGLEVAVKKLVGMFAFALYDRKEKRLHLVRDRIGEKPIYYGNVGSSFVFASELKAIKKFPGFKGVVDRDSLSDYLRYNYVPAPKSIYKDIYKLVPGTILTINSPEENYFLPVPYWSLLETAQYGIHHMFQRDEEEIIKELEALLKQSIKGQMISDVPLGAFLSGGIDSSTIVALMQSESMKPIKTFTIGFNEEGFNEAKEAKKVALHLGTEHTELYVQPKEAMSVIPNLATLYDEPFADSSQIPTFLVSQLARQQVTVSLSGDGGDELFGGYNRYFHADNAWKYTSKVPYPLRSVAAKSVRKISVESWDNLFGIVTKLLPPKYRIRLFGDKMHKMAYVIESKDLGGVYQNLISLWKKPSLLIGGQDMSDNLFSQSKPFIENISSKEIMMYLDTITYLPNDILVKVDRAAMGVSLESRIPFLDHRIIEFAWQMPISMKIKQGVGKWPLRKVLYKYVPKEMIERPKMGFGIPIDNWLRGPLKEWAENLLDEKRLKNEGFFNPQPILQKWGEHLKGTHNWQYYLWNILMFEAWLENQTASN